LIRATFGEKHQDRGAGYGTAGTSGGTILEPSLAMKLRPGAEEITCHRTLLINKQGHA